MAAPIITYCTNIHAARGLVAVKAALERVSVPLKERLSPHEPLPLGLRLSDEESKELDAPDAMAAFQTWLDERGVRVACVNGFPFGSFHGQRVKDDVHRPDWGAEERVQYSLRLGRLLAHWLPPGAHGGVSTSPLSYARWGDTAPKRAHMTHNIARVAAEYARLSAEHGVDLHLDIEPEPDGVLATSKQCAAWFESEFLPTAVPVLRETLGLSQSEAEKEARIRVAVCLDTCHAAVEFEEAQGVLANYAAAGMRIGRVQVSSALRVDIPPEDAARAALADALAPFAESTYLHQTIGRRDDGALDRWPDLPDALRSLPTTHTREWRIHYHVPIFHPGAAPLLTTQPQTSELIRMIHSRGVCDLFEAETYTWEVLPPALRLDLTDSIERELRWLRDSLLTPPNIPGDALR